MSQQFDIMVPDGEDPASVYLALLVELTDYYEDMLALRTAERDFHESQSFVYIHEIARLNHEHRPVSLMTQVATLAKRAARRGAS